MATLLMLPIPNRTGNRGGQCLKMTQLTLVIWLAVITAQQFKSVPEASEIEKLEIESEECRGGNQPQHDQRQLGPKNTDFEKNETRHGIGHRLHGGVDGRIDTIRGSGWTEN